MDSRQRNLVLAGIAALGMAVLVAAGLAFKRPLLEQWYVWKLSSSDENVRQRAAQRLVDIRSLKVVPYLRKLIESDDSVNSPNHTPGVAAVLSLVQLGSGGVEAIREVLRQKNQDFRWRAFKAMAEEGSNMKTALPLLLDGSRDDYPRVRANAAVGLSKIASGEDEALEALITALDDEEQMVHQIAVKGVGGCLHDQRALQGLFKALGDSSNHHWVSKELASAGEAVVLELLNEIERKDLSFFTRATLVFQMLGPKAKAAVPVLKDSLNHENKEVRKAAARALNKIEGESPRDLR